MSQAGLPVSIAAASSAGGDDLSAVTGTTGAPPSEYEKWVKPNEAMAVLFDLRKPVGNFSSHVWNFFTIAYDLLPDISMSDDGMPKPPPPKSLLAATSVELSSKCVKEMGTSF